MGKRDKRRQAPEPVGDVLDKRAFWPRLMQYQRLEEARHTSARTLQTRLECLTDFIHWCVERGLRQPAEVTRPVLEQYQRTLFLYRKANGAPLSVRSQRSRLGSVQGWFRWQMRQGLLLSNPAADLLLPKEPYKLPKDVLSAEEAERVMAVADVSTAAGLRDRALLELLYSTGMRRMEICGLDIWSVSQERGTVTIRQGKGRKERIVPVGARALGWVARYLAEGRDALCRGKRSDALFLANDGEGFSPGGLTHHIGRYVRQSGVRESGSCHLFRHTMATLMLENGADTRWIQAMLGHSRLETTQIYTRVSIRALKEIHTATHPAEQRDRSEVDNKEQA
ncbi:site-specific tyrosine recombinase XerC [Erwinia psidii]|uniref:Site-specific tyrosine recombinase XerC n=1 Tax=Erwinia psidii TaxID=69224 RepID=A0A3N6SHQ2_9GAMM|nr:site-specific tyrosine recombinase XerC [Erwinia psidii]MCX8957725.1 site-specific tyrosine recombinase XerC [Erwinia psidii]RQM39463.1 site-specific tyrosine recombinase XerC [Erwinia psidii]